VTTPTISVVIPTRDRPDHIGKCVESVLANDGVAFDLTVVDQSETSHTASEIKRFRDDPRFRYIASATRGVSAARNVGVQQTTGDVVVFTDDDCRVPLDWLSQIRDALAAEDAGVLYGRVDLPEDRPLGSFAASFHPTNRRYSGELPSPTDPWGISANMAVRRDAFDRVGYFDEALGVGGRFGSGGETDFTIRAIAAGETVSHVDGFAVVHLGLRDSVAASALMRRYGVGLGAVFVKHLRLRSHPGASMLPVWVVRHGSLAVRRFVAGQRPTSFGFVLGIVQGGARAARAPLDRARSIYATDS
jgi:glycosyltransferase involved in cell wall biosynthesis